MWNYDALMKQIAAIYEREGLREYWPPEEANVRQSLEQISKSLGDARFVEPQAIGVGGTGIVLRLLDSKFPELPKALKFPRPVSGKIELVAELINKEIRHLSALRHPGIVRIEYFDDLHTLAHSASFPFYLMEFVAGPKSLPFVQQTSTSEFQFIALLHAVCGALTYLHESAPFAYAHLDLKHENIVVTQNGQPVIIDLGTCKRLDGAADKTAVAVTRPNAHPAFLRMLLEDPSDDNRNAGNIPRQQIQLAWDLWALGLTFLDWLGLERDSGRILDGAIYNRLSPYTRKYVLLLVARLLNYDPYPWLSERIGLDKAFLESFPVLSAREVMESIGRMSPGNGPLYEIEEMATPSSGSIQAARGQQVPCTPALDALLGHPLYRRLNSITQLGLVCHVYPGAKHTRREHSLGTYANTRKMLWALYNDSYSPFFRQVITKEDCRAVLLAALLHDIGQYPLGHDLEEYDKRAFSHSALTQAMLKGQLARKRGKPLSFPSLNGVYAKWGVVSRQLKCDTIKPEVNGHPGLN